LFADKNKKSLVEIEREKQAAVFKEVSMSEKIIGMKGQQLYQNLNSKREISGLHVD